MIEGYNNYTKEILARKKGLEQALIEAKTDKEIDAVFNKYDILNMEYRIKILHLIHGSDLVTPGVPAVEHCKIEDCYEFVKSIFLIDPHHRELKKAYNELEKAGLILGSKNTKKEVKSITRKEVLEMADILTKQFMGNLKTEVSKAVDEKLKEKE